MAWATFVTFFPTFAQDEHGLSLITVGLLFSAFPIGGTIGSLTVGPLSNWVRRRKPFIFTQGFIMPVLYLTILSMGPDNPLISWLPDSFLSSDSWTLALIPFLVIQGMMTSSVVPMIMTVPFDMQFRPREVAVAVGLIRTITPSRLHHRPGASRRASGGNRLARNGAVHRAARLGHSRPDRHTPPGITPLTKNSLGHASSFPRKRESRNHSPLWRGLGRGCPARPELVEGQGVPRRNAAREFHYSSTPIANLSYSAAIAATAATAPSTPESDAPQTQPAQPRRPHCRVPSRSTPARTGTNTPGACSGPHTRSA